jgi:tellurite methyltransferase
MGYDERYKKTEDYFGPGATPLLRKYHLLINKARPVLDIGAGQGRNTLFLARNRYMVDAIDPSEVAIDTVSAIVAKERLPVRTYCCAYESFVPEVDFYSGILIFGLLQILSRESIDLLLQKVRAWTGDRSVIFVTTFTTADPLYPERSQKWKKIGKRMSPRHRHGDGPLEQHGMAEAVFQR